MLYAILICAHTARFMHVLTNIENHNTDNHEVNQNGSRSLYHNAQQIPSFQNCDTSSTYTFAQGATRTNKETSTDGATDGNHVQVTMFQRLVKLVVSIGQGARLEGLRRAAHPRPEAKLRSSIVVELDSFYVCAAIKDGFLFVKIRFGGHGEGRTCKGKEVDQLFH